MNSFVWFLLVLLKWGLTVLPGWPGTLHSSESGITHMHHHAWFLMDVFHHFFGLKKKGGGASITMNGYQFRFLGGKGQFFAS